VLLEGHDISVEFGGVRAVWKVSIGVEAGQILGLIGPNGAGKTTLIDAVSGFVESSGEVSLAGIGRIDHLAPHKRARAGLSRTWQSGELFDDLSVVENVRLGSEIVGVRRFLMDIVSPRRRPVPDRVHAALDRLHIADLADRLVTELSPGQAQLVGLARAIVSNPHVVLMDEPAGGLDSNETKLLARQIRELSSTGVGIVLVDHDMDLVFSICDRVHVMRTGETLAVGSVDEVRRNAAVRKAYLGTAHDDEVANAALPLPGAGVAL
jgi:branched-chain amino acid transport system ATP-binding protein